MCSVADTSCYKEGTPTLSEASSPKSGTDQEERLIIGSDSGDGCRTVTRHGREATSLIGGVMVDVSGEGPAAGFVLRLVITGVEWWLTLVLLL